MKSIASIRMLTVALAAALVLPSCGKLSSPTQVDDLLSSPLPVPTGMRVSPDELGRAMLVWDASPAANVAGFEIFVYSPSPNRSDAFVLVDEIGKNDDGFLLPTVAEPTVHYYRLRSTDGASRTSAFSPTVSVWLNPSGGGGDSDPVVDPE